MHRLRSFCALVMIIAAADLARADVGYSYIADQASYSGIAGSLVTVKLYLVESVSQSGANQTSLINRYFATPDFSMTYSGLSSVGVGVEQTGLSNGGTTSQILGPSIFTPSNVGYNGVSNNAGFTFGPDFTYNFTQRVGSNNVPMTGGSSASRLYQNIDDPTTGFNGNNLQVRAALGTTNSVNFYNLQNGVPTNAPYDTAGDRYGTGKILIGSLSISVGKGTTTFQIKPLAQTMLTNNTTSTFNTIAVTGLVGAQPGTVSTLSGSGGAGQTTLAATVFGGSVSLDQSYTSDTRPHSITYNSFNTVSSQYPVAGPSTGTASSLPFYTASSTPFTFTVVAVPEPSSIALCGLLSIAVVAGVRRKRRLSKSA
jgi:hypothetical protein